MKVCGDRHLRNVTYYEPTPCCYSSTERLENGESLVLLVLRLRVTYAYVPQVA